MFGTKRRLLAVILTLAGFLVGHAEAVLGQEPQEEQLPRCSYTLQSLRGTYAVVATYGGNAARALGVQTFDGHGGLKGSGLVNQPAPDGTRAIVNISFTGTYTVASDGTGVMSLTVALPNGSTAQATEDFVITRAQRQERTLLATELVDTQEQLSPIIAGGAFVTHTYTRRPE